MDFEWVFGTFRTKSLPGGDGGDSEVVRSTELMLHRSVAPKQGNPQHGRDPDPLLTRSVRRVSGSVQTGFPDNGPKWFTVGDDSVAP